MQFKELIIILLDRNATLNESKPFLYTKLRSMVESMSEEKCKSIVMSEGKESNLFKLIATTSLGMTAAQLALGRRKMIQCKEIASEIKNPEDRKRALAACHSGGI